MDLCDSAVAILMEVMAILHSFSMRCFAGILCGTTSLILIGFFVSSWSSSGTAAYECSYELVPFFYFSWAEIGQALIYSLKSLIE